MNIIIELEMKKPIISVLTQGYNWIWATNKELSSHKSPVSRKDAEFKDA